MESNVPILVLGGKGGGVSEGIIKALRLAKYNHIALMDYGERSAHSFRVGRNFLIEENPDSGNYIDKLMDTCRKYSYRVLIPGSTWESLAISERYDDFISNGIFPLVNRYDVVSICNDKWETYKFLTKNGLATPLTYYFGDKELSDDVLSIDFPVIIKPRIGRGSRNIFTAQNPAELLALGKYLKLIKVDFIIQEYIGTIDQEYTIGVVSGKDSEVVGSIVMKRLLGNGYTDYAEVCERSLLNDFCEKVANALKSTGPLNVQLRLDKRGQPGIFEINPRFSGSAPMRAIAGFNEPDLVIRNVMFDEKPDATKIDTHLKFFRVFQELYVDCTETNMQGRFKDYV